jgi:hypothetical protein
MLEAAIGWIADIRSGAHLSLIGFAEGASNCD